MDMNAHHSRLLRQDDIHRAEWIIPVRRDLGTINLTKSSNSMRSCRYRNRIEISATKPLLKKSDLHS
eukprot:scaffold14703_cov175-Ochromonas_danica.AAC.5